MAANRVRNVVFEARQITAPDAGSDFRTRERVPLDLGLPSLVLVQECPAQIRDFRKLSGSGNQFLPGGPVEGDRHRIASRALRKTAAEGTPGSPSTSIWRALTALTVASSMSSSRR
jgi:hypothetical protein